MTHTSLQAPILPLPPGAIDCHAHVFGPFERFPLAEDRKYTPPQAPFENYLHMLDATGFAHGVLVHAGANGYDNRVTLDALARADGRLRGVAVPAPRATPSELASMHAAGVRAIRFTETGTGKGNGVLDFSDLAQLAPHMRELGWHAQIWARCDRTVEAAEQLIGHGIPIVLDHMAYFDTEQGVGGEVFQRLLELMETGAFWVKMSALRNSKLFPTYDDVQPFHHALVQVAPDRLIWGSDWPFIGLGEKTPTAAGLINLFDAWNDDTVVRRKIFVDNPTTLYGF